MSRIAAPYADETTRPSSTFSFNVIIPSGSCEKYWKRLDRLSLHQAMPPLRKSGTSSAKSRPDQLLGAWDGVPSVWRRGRSGASATTDSSE